MQIRTSRGWDGTPYCVHARSARCIVLVPLKLCCLSQTYNKVSTYAQAALCSVHSFHHSEREASTILST